jgi:SAM-dependent methyltransferase
VIHDYPSNAVALAELPRRGQGATGARVCVACGASAATPLYRELVTCTQCGMVYFPGPVTPDQVRQLYTEDYFRGAEYLDYLADRSVHQANFRARAAQLAPWLPRGKRLFEIGASYGLFLDVARQWYKVRGCDIAAEPCRYARNQLGLEVECADFLDVPIEHGAVDAFCLWDTIEHLEDPGCYLERMADLLEPGGLLTLTTGDMGSWLARRQGPRWRQIHPPTHLWYFSQETMARTLERFGFEMVWFRHVGMARSIGQMVYSLTSLGRGSPSLLYRLCVKSGLSSLAVPLNTFDLMMVVARRRPTGARFSSQN